MKTLSSPIRLTCAVMLASLATPIATVSAAQSFTDVPPAHAAYTAAEYLKAAGILQGYADGSFKPGNPVNRAEATKVVVAPLVTPQQLAAFTTTPYTDVAAGAWYISYIEVARQVLNLIDGPPKATVFNGQQPVTLAQFLKIFLLSQKADVNGAYGEITSPLARDVQNASEWYYPYMRYALSSSLIQVSQSGDLQPGMQLTRADVAQLLFRYAMFKDGRRTQALLSEAESEIVNVLTALEAEDAARAEEASGRALLAARGALTSRPNDATVKAAVKVAEGFRQLVVAYKAGVAGQLQEAIAASGNAWNLAEKAKEFSPSIATVAEQMQVIAKTMADEARSLLATKQ